VLASLAGVGARVYGESVGDSGEHRNFFVFCIFWDGVGKGIYFLFLVGEEDGFEDGLGPVHTGFSVLKGPFRI
jgi:hypothetical protein